MILKHKWVKRFFPPASAYDLRYTQTLENFNNLTAWNLLAEITTDDVIDGNFSTVEAGTIVSFSVNQSIFAVNSVYFLAMRASDKNNLNSEISNPIQVTLKKQVIRFYKSPTPASFLTRKAGAVTTNNFSINMIQLVVVVVVAMGSECSPTTLMIRARIPLKSTFLFST